MAVTSSSVRAAYYRSRSSAKMEQSSALLTHVPGKLFSSGVRSPSMRVRASGNSAAKRPRPSRAGGPAGMLSESSITVTVRGHIEIVQMQADKDANVDAEGEVYGTALREAVSRDHKEIIQMLLIGLMVLMQKAKSIAQCSILPHLEAI
ncbi:hypothetical protein QQZ08_007268 [Neonectria magnoliae]|uniref:Uncharacterized protein n=1 Tax=Neonectria magnoliae TaxID=2732573 RepID=A0ABR1HYF2_9HYPO